MARVQRARTALRPDERTLDAGAATRDRRNVRKYSPPGIAKSGPAVTCLKLLEEIGSGLPRYDKSHTEGALQCTHRLSYDSLSSPAPSPSPSALSLSTSTSER